MQGLLTAHLLANSASATIFNNLRSQLCQWSKLICLLQLTQAYHFFFMGRNVIVKKESSTCPILPLIAMIKLMEIAESRHIVLESLQPKYLAQNVAIIESLSRIWTKLCCMSAELSCRLLLAGNISSGLAKKRVRKVSSRCNSFAKLKKQS